LAIPKSRIAAPTPMTGAEAFEVGGRAYEAAAGSTCATEPTAENYSGFVRQFFRCPFGYIGGSFVGWAIHGQQFRSRPHHQRLAPT